MKNRETFKVPAWHGFANAILDAITDNRKPPLETETEAQIAAEIAELWAESSAEAAFSPDETEAMAAANEDLLAADATGQALPDLPVDLPLALMCSRVAQAFCDRRTVADLTRAGAVTVVQIADAADLSILGDVVRNGLIPKHILVAQTLRGSLREKAVHCLSVFRGDGSASTLKAAVTRVEDALAMRPALIVMLSDPALLPKSLRDVLPKPIRIPPLSREAVLYALTKSHSRTGRVDRKSLLASLPDDQGLSRLSKVQLFRAFRETSSLRVAQALAAMAAVRPATDRLSELEGSGALHVVAQQIVADMKAFADGTLPWSDVPRGLLLNGAPGTGKTYAAQCIADAAGLPFIAATVGGWQSFGHLGDMLKAMIATFEEARSKAPCILFIDELDSIGDRKDSDGHGKNYRRQVVNELLAQMNGVADTEGIMLIGATNHVDDIDAAILRAGRIDMHVTVPLPDARGIERVLRHHLGADILPDLSAIVTVARGRTPSDIAGAIRLARLRHVSPAEHLCPELEKRWPLDQQGPHEQSFLPSPQTRPAVFPQAYPGVVHINRPCGPRPGDDGAALGNRWIGHFSQEFDLMLDQFIFMVPPLPEHLVARCFEDCLTACLSKLPRGRRLARMTGRSRNGYLENNDIQEVVLQSLIEDGICRHMKS